MFFKKVCCFYVSEFHLITILLSFINKIENENRKQRIVTIFEQDISKKVKIYLKNVKDEKINLTTINNLNVNWKKAQNVKKLNIENKIVIIAGREMFISKINEKVNLDKALKVVNCYDLNNTKNISEIIVKYSAILNTSGEKFINENSHNEQKRKTIKSQI